MKLRRSIIVGIVLLFIPAIVHAAPAGFISALEGTVSISPPGAPARVAVLYDEVNVGETVTTGSASKAEITFSDGNITRLAQDTRLQITEYVSGKDRKRGILNLFRGKVQSIVQTVSGQPYGINQDNKFEVHTPTAVCGVRGTNFFSYYIGGISGYIFKEGMGYGYNKNYPDVIRNVSAGQALLVYGPDQTPVIELIQEGTIEEFEWETLPGGGTTGGTTGSTSQTGGGEQELPGEPENPPELEDITPPSLSIIMKPDALTTSNSASFLFGSDDSSAIYAFKIDDFSGEYDWFYTSDPDAVFLGIPEGDHQIQVKAIDSFGNESDVMTYAWTTDYTGPDVSILGAPDELTNQDTAAFSFGSAETPITYAYSLDGEIWTATGTTLDLSEVPEGENELFLKGMDSLGNEGPTVSYAWMTDYTGPDVSILGTPDELTNQDTAAFSFGSAETPITYAYSLDGDTWTPTGATLDLSGIPEGENQLFLKGTDSLGNEGPTVSYAWTTDYTGPDVSILGTPDELTNQDTAAFSFGSEETPITYVYSLNGATWTATGTTLDLSEVPEGENELFLKGTDSLGNEGPTVSYAWTTDYTGPDVSITGGPDELTNQNTAAFTFGSEETPITYAYSLDGEIWTATGATLDLSGIPEGENQLFMKGSDNVGNESNIAIYIWSTDYTAPDVLFMGTPDEFINQPMAVFSFGADEAPVTYSYSLDNGETWIGTGDTLNLFGLGEGVYEILLTATDEAGNTSPAIAYGWAVDMTNPFIDALTVTPVAGTIWSNITTSSDEIVTFSYSLDGGETWYVTGGTLDVSDIPAGQVDLLVSATDLAGNDTQNSYSFYLNRYFLSGLASGTGSDLEGSATGDVSVVLDDNWGSWLIDMNGTYTGTHTLAWNLLSGGDVLDENELSVGYWLSSANGTYDGTDMSGFSSLTYLTRTTISRGNTGTVTGSYDAGSSTWDIQDSGIDELSEISLSFSSDIGASFYYGEDNDGYPGFVNAGDIAGLMGGSATLWDGTDIYSYLLGSYSHEGKSAWYGSEIYSSNASNESYTTYDGGAYCGLMGGVEENDLLRGGFLGIYIAPDGEAGYLLGDLEGTGYPDIDMFEMTGTMNRDAVTAGCGIAAQDLSDNLYYGLIVPVVIRGEFLDGGMIGGYCAQGDTLSIFDYSSSVAQNWGIYGLSLYGTFWNETTDWAMTIGGDGSFGAYGDGTGNYGYFMLDVWQNEEGEGVDGRFLTYTTLGTMGGDGFLSSNSLESSWEGVFLGAWNSEPLSFSGDIYELNGWDEGPAFQLYTDTGEVFDFTGGYVEGLMGGLESTWYPDPFAVVYQGEYDAMGYAPGTPYIWNSVVYSYNWLDDTYTTYDGGAYRGFAGGVWSDSDITGRTIMLSVFPDGSVGYLTGDLAGRYYQDLYSNDIGIYEADGTWTSTVISSPGLLDPAVFYESISTDADMYVVLGGTFSGGNGSLNGSSLLIDGDITWAGWTQYLDGLDWGIYNVIIDGYGSGYTNPDGDTDWTGKLGGTAVFGTVFDGEGYVSDQGYWIAGIPDGGWQDGILDGTLSGTFISAYRMGSITGDMLGYYDESGNWAATGMGVYEGVPLAFSGQWGETEGGTLYYNNAGNFTAGGDEFGLIGSFTLPAAGPMTCSIMGIYGLYEEPSPSLFNTVVEGWDTATGGDDVHCLGYAAGVWSGESMFGSILALYGDSDDMYGILADGSFSGSFYPEIGMWDATSTLTLLFTEEHALGNVSAVEGTLSMMSGNYAFSGTFDGDGYIRAADLSGTTLFFYSDVTGSAPWGIYDLKIGSSENIFSRPAGADSWQAVTGGSGEFGYDGAAYDWGYWLASVNGSWSADGVLEGYLGNDPTELPDDPDTWSIFLSYYLMGTLQGPFYGISDSGTYTWIGESVGAWECDELAYFAFTDNAPGTYELYGAPPEQPFGWLDDVPPGFVGGLASPWYGPADIVVIGDYRSDYDDLYQYIWINDLYSHDDSRPLDEVTFDDGAFYGFIGGAWNGGAIDAGVTALYRAPDGTIGVLLGSLGGGFYHDLRMFQVTGSWEPITLGTTVIPADLFYESVQESRFAPCGIYGTFTSGGSISGDVFNVLDGWTRYLDDEDFGIFTCILDGSWDNPLDEQVWTGTLGGNAVFGTVWDGSENVDDTGYWIAAISDGTWQDGSLTGTVSPGIFLSEYRMGTISGELTGYYYDEADWAGIGLGMYEGERLLLSGTVSGNLYRNDSGTVLYAGDVSGLIGSTGLPWDAIAAPYRSMGRFTFDHVYTHYLWNGTVTAQETSGADGLVAGYTGGIAVAENLFGNTIAIFINEDGEAGFLTGDVDNCGYYDWYYDSDSGHSLWYFDGLIGAGIKNAGIDVASCELSSDVYAENPPFMYANLAGAFLNDGYVGYIYGGPDDGSTTFFLYEGEAPGWGIYDFKMATAFGGGFDLKPAGDAEWYAGIGGDGEFDESGSGYWSGTVLGTWTDTGEIIGNLDGVFLTQLYTGTMTGTFFGISDAGTSGTWIGESVGAYEATDSLTFSGRFNGDVEVGDGFGGYVEGIIGGTDPLVGDPTWGDPGTAVGSLCLGIYDGDSLFGFGGSLNGYIGGGSLDNTVLFMGELWGDYDSELGYWDLSSSDIQYMTGTEIGIIELPGSAFWIDDQTRTCGYDWDDITFIKWDDLALGGTWGGDSYPPASLYYLDNGSFVLGGHEWGLIGAIEGEGLMLVAMGKYDCDEELAFCDLLWNSRVSGGDFDGNTFEGFTAGLWRSGDTTIMDGYMIAITDVPIGFLVSDISGYADPLLKMWMIGISEDVFSWVELSEPPFIDETINPDKVGSGNLGITFSGLSGSFVDEVMEPTGIINGDLWWSETMFFYDDSGISPGKETPFTWGVCDLKFGGALNTYEGKPFVDDIVFLAYTGGTGTFGYSLDSGDDTGYWIASLLGSWYGDGTINGYFGVWTAGDVPDLVGFYITHRQTGNMGGWLYGLHDTVEDGTWIGESVGFYGGHLLNYASDVTIPLTAASYNPELEQIEVISSGTLSGILGGFISVEDEFRSTFIGDYIPPGPGSIWSGTFYSHNFVDGTNTTYDGGHFYGYIGGNHHNDILTGGLIGMYIDPDGIGAGYRVINYLEGRICPAIEMFEITGWGASVNGMQSGDLLPGDLSDPLNRDDDALILSGEGAFWLSGDGYIDIGYISADTGFYDAKYTSEFTSIKNENWGIWWTNLYGGYDFDAGYDESSPDYWQLSLADDTGEIHQWVEIYSPDWNDGENTCQADVTGAWLDWNDAVTGVMGGTLKGTFNAATFTWEATALGTWMDTEKFLDMVSTNPTELDKLKIPAVEIGRTDLVGWGPGENYVVYMDNVIFFGYSSGAPPRIWATNEVYGSFISAPSPGDQAIMDGTGFSENVILEIQQWGDKALDPWSAEIYMRYGGYPSGSVGGYNVDINGAAAGTITQLPVSGGDVFMPGLFTGNGAGTSTVVP